MPVADAAMTLPASMYRDVTEHSAYERGRSSRRHEAAVHQFQELVRAALAPAARARP